MMLRRDLLTSSMAVAAAPWFWGARQDRKATPANIEGPYYKKGAPKSDTLVKDGDAGMPLVVEGKVEGVDGKALADATVDVWHADPDGKYDNDGFHFRAVVPVDKEGRYRFETVLPGHYGIGGYGEKGDTMRPQHIHYKVGAAGHAELTTQLYFETDPFFETDPAKNLAKDPFVKFRQLVVPLLIERKKKVYVATGRFDIVLAKA